MRCETKEIIGLWSPALPIKTSIKGSDDPNFEEYGILTGRVTDQEGIFIETLIPMAHTSFRSVETAIGLLLQRIL